jgi:hypothetical protein
MLRRETTHPLRRVKGWNEMRDKAYSSLIHQTIRVRKSIAACGGVCREATQESKEVRVEIARLEKVAAMTSAVAALVSAGAALVVAIGHMSASKKPTQQPELRHCERTDPAYEGHREDSEVMRTCLRRTQNPPTLKACRFDSDLGHHNFTRSVRGGDGESPSSKKMRCP